MKRRKSNQDKRRKEEKRLEKLNRDNISFQSKWFILFCVVIVFAMFYILTVYITNKDQTKKSDTESKTATGEILLGRSFSMSDRDYAVLYYDSSDEEVASTCQEIFSDYRAANGEDSIYYVDMNSGFNSPYATEADSNKSPETVSDLLINGPTLIKISQNKVVDYIEGVENIKGLVSEE